MSIPHYEYKNGDLVIFRKVLKGKVIWDYYVSFKKPIKNDSHKFTIEYINELLDLVARKIT